jgi:hypothetical protein
MATGTRVLRKGRSSMKLSLVPMLIAGESISPEARQALRENRLKDAVEILMRRYDLSCVEAGDLLDVSVCDCEENDAKGGLTGRIKGT